MKYHLVLASQSPRRKELLGYLNLPFEILPSHENEENNEKDPVKHSQQIALLKANSIAQKNQFKKSEKSIPVIVGADTIVVLEGQIFGKPSDKNAARLMLQKMSGKTHDVYTSVVILCEERQRIFSVKTQVTFDHISADLLEKYLDTGDSLDKAGSYGIQGGALSFISRIEGSYSNVVGFPLSDFAQELSHFLSLNLSSNDWRLLFC